MEPLISKFSRRVSGVATRFNNWSRPVELHSRFGFPGLLRVAQQSRRLIAREDVGLSRLHTIIPNPDRSGCAEIARYSPGSTQVSSPRDNRSRCPLLSCFSKLCSWRIVNWLQASANWKKFVIRIHEVLIHFCGTFLWRIDFKSERN